MKLKIGNVIFDSKAFWLLFAQGVLIGLMVAAKHTGSTVLPAMFIVVNIIIIPAMARHLFRDEDKGIENMNR